MNELERISEAVHDLANSDRRRIALEVVRWGDLLLRKNNDYGGSAWTRPLLCGGNISPREAILVRMSDKIERLIHLRSHPATVEDETLEDTIQDLGAYCLLWMACPDEERCSWRVTTSHKPTAAEVYATGEQ